MSACPAGASAISRENKVAASQAQATQDWAGVGSGSKDRSEILMDNVFRRLRCRQRAIFLRHRDLCVCSVRMNAAGISVQADPNDVPTSLLRPAELISLSNMPASAEMQHPDVALQHEPLWT